MTEASVPLCPQCQCDLHDLFGPDASTKLTFCPQCQFPQALVAGKYRLQKLIGQGGFGKVYLAEHVRLTRDRERVVKILNPEIFELPGMEARFFREVQVTSSVARNNEHIVRIYDDFGKHEQLGHFYVMEYLEGQPLSNFLIRGEPLPLELALHIFEQLCEAMDTAHAEQVIHRDLKPDNIMLIQRKQDDAFVKVLDFGIAKPTDTAGMDQTQLTQGALGTPLYMSPEQWANKPIDVRIDIYAMGLILYQMLTGQLPFAQKHSNMSMQDLVAAHLHHAPLPWSQTAHGKDLPPPLEPIVLKALEKNPANRHASAKAFWEALDNATPALGARTSPSLASITLDRQITLPPEKTADFAGEQVPHTPENPLPTGDSHPEFVPPTTPALQQANPSSLSLSSAQDPAPATKSSSTMHWLGLSLLLCALIVGGLAWWVTQPTDTTQTAHKARKAPPQRTAKRRSIVLRRLPARRVTPRTSQGPCPADGAMLRWLLLKLPPQHKAKVQALDGKPPIAKRQKVPGGVCIGLAKATSLQITAPGQIPCHFPVAFQRATLQIQLKESSFDNIDPSPEYCTRPKSK